MKSFITSKQFILIGGIGWCLFFLWCTQLWMPLDALTSKDIKVSCLPGTCLLDYNGKNMFIIKEAELRDRIAFYLSLSLSSLPSFNANSFEWQKNVFPSSEKEKREMMF
jgi:hypothetical protein